MPEPTLKKDYAPAPSKRRLQVFAFDPSLSNQYANAEINRMTLAIPWEKLEKGPDGNSLPVGEYLEVVDIDPASGVFYPPVDLDHPSLLARDGLDPSEDNPQFHQQMVYAVVMATIARFEKALGRRVLWSEGGVAGQGEPEFVRRLRIYPHAMRKDDAYYDPNKKALLFGYFPLAQDNPANVVEGGRVFTCLSHDIIVHEATHAILDGMQSMFIHKTNPDMRAMHEALADIMAFFERFTFPEVVKQEIARTGGDLTSENMLCQIAQQFGQAVGNQKALRDVIGEIDKDTGKWRRKQPNPQAYTTLFEEHDRSEILVGAVVDAFLAMYNTRAADLVRMATGGRSRLPDGETPSPDLVNRLAKEVTHAADHTLTLCIRGLDYLPPVDVTFGDYLRAIVTADTDMVPDDRFNYRVAFIEAFWKHGIKLQNVRSLSQESLRWRPPDDRVADTISAFFSLDGGLASYAPPYVHEKDPEAIFDRAMKNRKNFAKLISTAGFKDRAAILNELWLAYGDNVPQSVKRDEDGNPHIEVKCVRPTLRFTPEGALLNDLLVQLVQERQGYIEPEDQANADAGKPVDVPAEGKFTLYGGSTLIFNLDTGAVRYAIGKRVDSERRLNEARFQALNERSR